MAKQRLEPVDRLWFLPSLLQPTGIVEGCWWVVEQAKHRKVDLAFPIIGGRVDQARYLVLVGEDIAAPQIAMERHRRRRRGMFGEPKREPADMMRQMRQVRLVMRQWQARHFSVQNAAKSSVPP